MRKGLLIVLLTLLCGAVLVFSYLTWQERLEEASAARPGVVEPESSEAGESVESPGEPAIDSAKLAALAANTDESVREVLQARLDAGEDARLLVIGSAAIKPVADGLANAIHEAYEGFISVDAYVFDGTSQQFVDGEIGKVDWARGYDVVLYEPFTLNNNGNVIIEDEHAHIAQVEERAMEAVKDAAFLVTPPQPIPNANFYITQINSLKAYAEAQGIPYIDHWTKWPAVDSPELGDYLDAQGMPTQQGVDAWTSGLTGYFIAE